MNVSVKFMISAVKGSYMYLEGQPGKMNVEVSSCGFHTNRKSLHEMSIPSFVLPPLHAVNLYVHSKAFPRPWRGAPHCAEVTRL